MSDQTLDELRRMHEEATPRPWKYIGEMVDTPNGTIWPYTGTGGGGKPCTWPCRRDAALIAAMRNALPGLLNEIERLRSACSAALAWCTEEDGQEGSISHLAEVIVPQLEAALEGTAPRRDRVYAVVFGNYHPREVNALYASREDAVAAAERLNDMGDSMWNVEEMALS